MRNGYIIIALSALLIFAGGFFVLYFIFSDYGKEEEIQFTQTQSYGDLSTEERSAFRSQYNAEFEDEAVALDEREMSR